MKTFESAGDLIRVTLPCGRETIIDMVDGDLLTEFPVWVFSGGYVSIERSIETKWGILRQRIYLARAIIVKVFGLPAIKHYLVDHHDRDRLNNSRTNLRLATYHQNHYNRGASSQTGFKGVCRVGRPELRKQFVVYIGGVGDTPRANLGYFLTAEEGARAYDAEAKRRFGEFAYLNFPEEKT